VILINTATRTITEVNQRFAEAMVMPADSCTKIRFEDIFDDSALVPGILSALNSRCSSYPVEVTLRRGDGSVWDAVLVGRRIASDHAVLTCIDITERKKADNLLRKCHSDTNLYLDILTHDINNMNSAALTSCRLLATRRQLPADGLFQKIQQSLEKIEDIIRNISVLRRLDNPPANLVPVSLSAVIRKEIDALPGVNVDYDGSDATVLADEMISSVFANLIGNAVKFGGDDPRITIRVSDQGQMAGVMITDTGNGIPDSLKPRIFYRFQRGDTTVSGKGIGLFICKSLIMRYGGTIDAVDRVEGDFSQGAAFRFTLKKA
jgi:signal transduction histidine kinase